MHDHAAAPRRRHAASVRRPVAAMFAALLLLAGCGGGSDGGAPPTEPPPPPAPRVPGQLDALSGVTTQDALVGTPVSIVPTVRVRTSQGAPVPGVAVAFALTGGGSLGATSAQTNAQGVASPGSWTLGTAAGENVLTATVGALPPVRFTAMGIAGAVARLELVSGDGQSAVVASPLPEPLVVRALDTHGNPIAGAVVTFARAADEGAEPLAVTTNAEGVATTGPWTLGPVAGSQGIVVRTGALPPLELRALAVAGLPAVVEFTGGGQSAPVGTQLPESPTIVVRDAHGNGVPGVPLRIVTSTGEEGGALTEADGRTDEVPWLLGGTAGTQVLTATVAGTTVSGQLTATALPGPAAALQLVSGGGQAGRQGEALAEPIVVAVVDVHGNRVGGAMVDFVVVQGGGSAAPARVVSDGRGEARTVWSLGADGTQHEVRASIPGTSAEWRVSATAAAEFLEGSQVAAGAAAQCALEVDESISCWGMNGVGQLGDGTTTFRATPAPIVAGGRRFVSLSMGLNAACALDENGHAWCWGSGPTGVGTMGVVYSTPVPVSGGRSFTSVAVGITTACAIAHDGTGWCWGTHPSNGESTLERLVPTLVSDSLRFAAISAGQTRARSSLADRNCGITTGGDTYCWSIHGLGSSGVSWLAPAPLPGSPPLASLESGWDHACGLTAAGEAFCWGRNFNGQLGIGTASATDVATPTAVATTLRFSALASGSVHTCGLTADGAVYCWGSNQDGILGTGSTSATLLTPSRVLLPDGVAFRTITSGLGSTCGTTATNEVYCWGLRQSGELSSVVDPAPVRVRRR